MTQLKQLQRLLDSLVAGWGGGRPRSMATTATTP